MRKLKNYGIAFGKTLIDLRKQFSISQERLAELSDLHRTYISFIETGKKIPTLSAIISISQAFNLKPSELLDLMEQKINEN